MKNNIKTFGVIWAFVFALFNMLVFVTPSQFFDGYNKFTDIVFWVCYIFAVIAFVAVLGCGILAFNKNKASSLFLSIPVIYISYVGLVVMLVASAACFMIFAIPDWLAAIVCLIVLVVTAIAVVAADAGAQLIENQDNRIKVKTFFIKSLTVDAENVMARARSQRVKDECKKVYEAVRYSDPMSDDSLLSVENQISTGFDSFARAVESDNFELVKAGANELIVLLNARNSECRLLK